VITEKVHAAGRPFTLDRPDAPPQDGVVFVLNLHGAGSQGSWQREYFPVHDHVDEFGLVVATPTAATTVPFRRWVAEADDAYLQAVVEQVLDRYAGQVRSCWLAGHSQGGMTSNRLLRTDWWADRVDGWLSLSGGRLGQAPLVEGVGPPLQPGQQPIPPEARARMFAATQGLPAAEFSFVFAVGEHEIVSLPDTSPWAERFGGGRRVRRDDLVDDEPGRIHDTRPGRATRAWGGPPRPGTAEVYVYPELEGGRVVADVLRKDKGHTEGLEPRVVRTLVELMAAAPGGKLQRLG
jgi:hypothetical protein